MTAILGKKSGFAGRILSIMLKPRLFKKDNQFWMRKWVSITHDANRSRELILKDT